MPDQTIEDLKNLTNRTVFIFRLDEPRIWIAYHPSFGKVKGSKSHSVNDVLDRWLVKFGQRPNKVIKYGGRMRASEIAMTMGDIQIKWRRLEGDAPPAAQEQEASA